MNSSMLLSRWVSMDRQKARRVMLGNNRIKAYCALILVCSIISLPDNYKIGKSNLLNQWFVKLGWFWTSLLMLPVSFFAIRSDDRESLSRAIFRFIMGTLLWFCSVNIFQFVDDITGFDISGHTFLLIFSNLLIASELKLATESYTRTDNPNKKNTHDTRLFLEDDIYRFNTFKRPLVLLTLIWDFMLIQTAFYYHTLIQKGIAALWAFSAWYILHVIFYDDGHH